MALGRGCRGASTSRRAAVTFSAAIGDLRCVRSNERFARCEATRRLIGVTIGKSWELHWPEAKARRAERAVRASHSVRVRCRFAVAAKRRQDFDTNFTNCHEFECADLSCLGSNERNLRSKGPQGPSERERTSQRTTKISPGLARRVVAASRMKCGAQTDSMRRVRCRFCRCRRGVKTSIRISPIRC